MSKEGSTMQNDVTQIIPVVHGKRSAENGRRVGPNLRQVYGLFDLKEKLSGLPCMNPKHSSEETKGLSLTGNLAVFYRMNGRLS